MKRLKLATLCLAVLSCAGCVPQHRLPDGMEESQRSERFRAAIPEFGPLGASIRREWGSFGKESGCDLELELVAMEDGPLYDAMFKKEELKGGDWDIALVNTDWLAEAHETKAVVDLGPYIAKSPPEDYPEGWAPSLLRLQQFGQQVIGLPYHDGPECLIYRTDWLDRQYLKDVHWAKFGMEMHPPQTWEDFTRLAQFLKRPENDLYGTVFAAYPDGYSTVYDICLLLWTRGGELFDNDGKMQLDTPEMIDALTYYRSLFDKPSVVHPKARKFDSAASDKAFLRGEAVMMIGAFGFAVVCETSEDSKVKGKVAIAPVPHAVDHESASLNAHWLLCVPAGSPHKQVAYDFARHCMTAANDKQRTLGGAVGCRRSTWADEEILEAFPFYAQMEQLHENARELPRLTNWTEVAKVIDWMAQEAITTQDTIDSIAARAQEQADELQKQRE